MKTETYNDINPCYNDVNQWIANGINDIAVHAIIYDWYNLAVNVNVIFYPNINTIKNDYVTFKLNRW